MDSSSSSSSSSLVVDILYRLDKLHVAASVYGNGIERSVLYNSILLYCFIYMYIYNVYRFSFCLFILFLYIYFLFCGERERERTLAMTNVNGKNLICLESIFLDYLQVWFGFFWFLIRYEIIRTKIKGCNWNYTEKRKGINEPKI